ncbi:hypothetical protein [Gloeothece verrucosa]|uniref:Uncharacterized protein n=1 Tax=Gloeothece verrucosa (strain PCC 7822) TaxID=497965 RepID=E0UMY0_GLOV7|nr:hypothetical protein [Gloeothece verrucosa]ADN18310.1 conserved hypothetical protein [Gloeothece verrucosa PCC 7822]
MSDLLFASNSIPVVTDDYLTSEEEQELLQLEGCIERSFYQAGQALKAIRDKRLYRFLYATFEDYCRERFGFARRHSYQLIDAAVVMDNLLAIEAQCESGAQTENISDNLCANGAQTETIISGETPVAKNITPRQILPTSERQVRPLTSLNPSQQREAWAKAVHLAKGKVPSNRIVTRVAEQIRSSTAPAQDSSHAYHLKLNPSGLVKIHDSTNPMIDQCLGRIACVNSKTVEVWVRDVEQMVINKYNLKHNQVQPLSFEQEPSIKEIVERLTQLRHLPLDPFEIEILNLLDRVVVLTPVEEQYLALIGQNHQGVKAISPLEELI